MNCKMAEETQKLFFQGTNGATYLIPLSVLCMTFSRAKRGTSAASCFLTLLMFDMSFNAFLENLSSTAVSYVLEQKISVWLLVNQS